MTFDLDLGNMLVKETCQTASQDSVHHFDAFWENFWTLTSNYKLMFVCFRFRSTAKRKVKKTKNLWRWVFEKFFFFFLSVLHIFYTTDRFKHTEISKNPNLITYISFLVVSDQTLRKSPWFIKKFLSYRVLEKKLGVTGINNFSSWKQVCSCRP